MWPDLPMPEITALPRQFSSSSQAQTKLSSSRASRRCASVQLNFQRFAGKGQQGSGVTHQNLLPE
jgi:hypothetical protein